MIPELQDFVVEFDTDPKVLGYKNGAEYKSTKELCRLLGAPQQIANPEAQQQVLKPFTLNELLGLISTASLANMESEAVVRVSDLVDEQHRTKLGLWITLAVAKGWITQAEADAVNARLAEAHLDPDYAATVLSSPRQDELGWTVSRERINEALGRPLEAWA